LEKRLKDYEGWLQRVKDFRLTDTQMKKELRENPEKLRERAQKLLDEKKEEKYEVIGDELKYVEKAMRWTRLVIDTKRIFQKDKDISLERIFEISVELERKKILDDVGEIGKLKSEMEKFKKWKEQLDQEYDIEKARELLAKGQKDIAFCIQEIVEEVES